MLSASRSNQLVAPRFVKVGIHCLPALTVFVGVQCGLLAGLTSNQKQDKKVKEATIEDLIGQDDSIGGVGLLRRLFHGADETKLRALRVGGNDTLAVRAAWERIRAGLPSEDLEDACKIKEAALQRFIGFVEGRVGITVPDWWEKAMMNARAYSRSNVFFEKPTLEKYKKTSGGFRAPKPIQVIGDDGSFTITDGVSLAILGKALCEYSEKHLNGEIDAMFSDARCYIVVHANRCSPYRLFCTENKSGRIVFEKSVWASAQSGHYSGVGWHWVDILVVKGRVWVFGVGDDGAYLESFDTRSGVSTFRFGTAFRANAAALRF